MIFRNRKYSELPITQYVQDELIETVTVIDESDLEYLDNIFLLYDQRLETIESMVTSTVPLLDEDAFVQTKYYRDLITRLANISRLNFAIIPECFTRVNKVLSYITTGSAPVTSRLAALQEQVRKIERNIGSIAYTKSIYDEYTWYDDFTSETVINTDASLQIDARARSLILPVSSVTDTGAEVNTVTVNRSRGSITPVTFPSITEAMASSGYYMGRLFSSKPRIENEQHGDYSLLYDGDHQTGYLVEETVMDQGEPFTVTYDIVIPNGKCDVVRIITDNGDPTSVLSDSEYDVSIEKVMVVSDGETIEVTDEITNETVKVSGVSLGTDILSASVIPPDIYPGIVIYLPIRNVTKVTVVLSNQNPQIISYPEKVVWGIDGTEVYRFSYPETLILNGYVTPDGWTNPSEWFTADDISEMNEIITSGSFVTDEQIERYRYFIGVKEITGEHCVYVQEGSAVTENIHTRDSLLLSVEIYAAETIPEGCAISYAISTNMVDWVTMDPMNRTIPTMATRILFTDDITPSTGDLVYEEVPRDKLYLRITMNGSEGKTPILKSYAVRMKTE